MCKTWWQHNTFKKSKHLQILLLCRCRKTGVYAGHCFIIHLPGGGHCPIARDSEPVRLLETPTSPSFYMLILIIHYSVLKLHIIIIIPASKRSERAATLIVTGFLWSIWPSRLGHDWNSHASSKLDFWTGWLAGWLRGTLISSSQLIIVTHATRCAWLMSDRMLLEEKQFWIHTQKVQKRQQEYYRLVIITGPQFTVRFPW